MAKRFATLTDEEILKVIRTAEEYPCKDPHRKPQLTALYTLLANLGLRISEAVALRWKDIDLARREITVHTLKKPGRVKGKKSNLVRDTLPIDDKTIAAILVLKTGATQSGDLIFPISRRVAYNIFQRVLHLACIRPIKMHALRHSAVTRWVRTGNLAFAMTMARHSNLATTSQYTHCDDLAEQFRHVTHIGREP